MPYCISFDQPIKTLFLHCSNECLLRSYENNEPDEIIFVGVSKGHNKGLKYGNHLLIERMADNWTHNHDFGVEINRADEIRNGAILEKIKALKHEHILSILGMCNCTIIVRYIDGRILNTKKGEWILGPHSYKPDYVNIASKEKLLQIIHKIGNAIMILHKMGVCHTDPTDHNVMIDSSRDEPILIDLIGAMPYSEELMLLDCRVFLDYFVRSINERTELDINNEIKFFEQRLDDKGLSVFLSRIGKRS